jgi:hypothetical protein
MDKHQTSTPIFSPPPLFFNGDTLDPPLQITVSHTSLSLSLSLLGRHPRPPVIEQFLIKLSLSFLSTYSSCSSSSLYFLLLLLGRARSFCRSVRKRAF